MGVYDPCSVCGSSLEINDGAAVCPNSDCFMCGRFVANHRVADKLLDSMSRTKFTWPIPDLALDLKEARARIIELERMLYECESE